MEIGSTKEVYFGEYCPSCKYCDRAEAEEPCRECLNVPSNEHSHRPVRWEYGK